ncbi:MAG: hypothetical protein CBD94_01420 [Gammaproteobacteria bacterium TMED234]|jgi:hypothetical protein|nr:MAG: hypothetical protein CBD94_01420 [Gammaproteobacteria bacterium TMED234]|tara:strand:- start:6088 stop:6447 length:360 start_codon:yes stop_codon:yes gene_type:complete
MIKSFLGAFALLSLGTSAISGPYFNPEFNGSTVGDDYLGGAVTLDIGYEDGGEGYSWFVQGGPALILPEGTDSDVELAGKLGGSIAIDAEENLSLYGELSGVTGDDFSWGSKLGAKVKF